MFVSAAKRERKRERGKKREKKIAELITQLLNYMTADVRMNFHHPNYRRIFDVGARTRCPIEMRWHTSKFAKYLPQLSGLSDRLSSLTLRVIFNHFAIYINDAQANRMPLIMKLLNGIYHNKTIKCVKELSFYALCLFCMNDMYFIILFNKILPRIATWRENTSTKLIRSYDRKSLQASFDGLFPAASSSIMKIARDSDIA